VGWIEFGASDDRAGAFRQRDRRLKTHRRIARKPSHGAA